MRDVLRTTLSLAVLTAVIFLGDRAGAFLCERILIASQFRFSRIYRGDAKAEIVVIGDSRGVHSFHAPSIERATGRRTLNLAYNAMTPPVAGVVLEDYLEHNELPRLVLIEVSSVCAVNVELRPLSAYGGVSRRVQSIFASSHPADARMAGIFHLLRYNNEFFLRSLLYFRHDDQDWINRSVMSPELANATGPPWFLVARPENLEPLVRTVRMLRARGVEVRLVLAPYHRAASIHDEELLRQLRESLPGEKVWTYTHELSSTSDFFDTVHLNLAGSEKLLRRLCADGVFSCRP